MASLCLSFPSYKVVVVETTKYMMPVPLRKADAGVGDLAQW